MSENLDEKSKTSETNLEEENNIDLKKKEKKLQEESEENDDENESVKKEDIFDYQDNESDYLSKNKLKIPVSKYEIKEIMSTVEKLRDNLKNIENQDDVEIKKLMLELIKKEFIKINPAEKELLKIDKLGNNFF